MILARARGPGGRRSPRAMRRFRRRRGCRSVSRPSSAWGTSATDVPGRRADARASPQHARRGAGGEPDRDRRDPVADPEARDRRRAGAARRRRRPRGGPHHRARRQAQHRRAAPRRRDAASRIGRRFFVEVAQPKDLAGRRRAARRPGDRAGQRGSRDARRRAPRRRAEAPRPAVAPPRHSRGSAPAGAGRAAAKARAAKAAAPAAGFDSDAPITIKSDSARRVRRGRQAPLRLRRQRAREAGRPHDPLRAPRGLLSAERQPARADRRDRRRHA